MDKKIIKDDRHIGLKEDSVNFNWQELKNHVDEEIEKFKNKVLTKFSDVSDVSFTLVPLEYRNEDDHYRPYFSVYVTFSRIETDHELERRLFEVKMCKENRHKQYLKLKEEFES